MVWVFDGAANKLLFLAVPLAVPTFLLLLPISIKMSTFCGLPHEVAPPGIALARKLDGQSVLNQLKRLIKNWSAHRKQPNNKANDGKASDPNHKPARENAVNAVAVTLAIKKVLFETQLGLTPSTAAMALVIANRNRLI